jgi:hypothetical protein
MVYESPARAIVSHGQLRHPWLRLRTSLDLTTSKNDAQATYGVTADPSFQRVMAAVPPPAGHGREAGCRCVADAITTSLTPPPAPAAGVRPKPMSALKILPNARSTRTSTQRASTISCVDRDITRRCQATHVGRRRRATERKMESLTGSAKSLVQLGGFEPPTS